MIAGLEGNKARPEDAQNLLSLLYELRAALDSYAQSIGECVPSRYLLSTCLAALPNRLNVLDLRALSEILDELHLMSYDLNGSWSPQASHQANLYGGPSNVDAAVNLILASGANPRKLILGVPMYGRAFCQTNGLGQAFQGVGVPQQEKGSWEGGVWDYKALPLEGAQEHFDAQGVAAYSYDKVQRQLISYESPQSLIAKVEYLKARGLGGVFFWELSGDKDSRQSPHRSLLETAFRSLNGPAGVDQSPNHLNYPQSMYDNVRGCAQPIVAAALPNPPPLPPRAPDRSVPAQGTTVGGTTGPSNPLDVVRLTTDGLSLDAAAATVKDNSAGAVTTFSGTTRDSFQGKRVVQLEYECYVPMAERELYNLIGEARARWPLTRVAIIHRLGVVPISETSVVVAVSSVHRDASLEAARMLIDRLKETVPIWKKEVYEDGSTWKENSLADRRPS